MASTDKNPQPKSDTDDKPERLLAQLKERAAEIRGNPTALLAATDEFSCHKTNANMMHVGSKKGGFVRKVVQELAPVTCLELGTYFGYSAVLMASVLPEGSRFITLEANETSAAFAKEFIELAGAQVSDKVTIVVKKSEDVIPTLREDFAVDTLDLVFIDHWKELYLRDLKLLETHGLLRKGTVILADNISYSGTREYREFVENSEKYQTELFYTKLENSDKEDGVAKSIYSG